MIVTKHAIKRVKERTGLKKKLAEKLLIKALDKGLKQEEVKGRLRKYVDWLYFQHENADNIRIYNDFVFICNKYAFITIFPIPREYRDLARRQQHKED